jgi:hypothetical protein
MARLSPPLLLDFCRHCARFFVGPPTVLLQVAQALLAAALQPPLTHMTARQLYQLLQAAAELGAAPSGSALEQVQAFLSS